MLGGVILLLSLLFQGIAIVLAVRLIRVTGWRTPWLLITGAVLLMAVRRGITSYQVFLGDLPMRPDPTAEVVALVISILMVAGLSRIAPSFRSAQSAETHLREQQHFLQRVLDTEPGTVYIYDLAERRSVFINRHWLRAYGYSAEETQSMDSDLLARLFHPDDLARIAAHHDTWRRAGDQDIREIEYRIRTKGGEWRWLHSREALFARDDSGQVKQVLGVAHDITERKQMGAMLSEREALLRAIVDTEPECVKLVGPDGRLLSMNPAGLAMIEADSFDQVRGRSIYPLVAKEHRPAFRALTERVFRGESGTLEFSVHGLKGRSRWLETKAVPFRSSWGEIVALLGVTRDITERKQAEAALREHGERLQLLTQQLVRVQEEEARRIGRELHDDLGQLLTTLKITLQTLPRRKDSAGFWEHVADLATTVDQAIERVRSVSSDLRPTILDDLGLTAALRWMLDRQAQQAGLKGSLSDCGIETRFPSELETTCFRVAQEALTNVVRHARATHVRIELRQEGDELFLQVSDDGAGFDPEQALADISKGKNLGLLGMQERVALMNGRLSIRSAPGRGTEVSARFPLPSHAASEVGP